MSKSDKQVSRIVHWLQNVTKATVKSFLNKHVDVVITDRDNNTQKGSHNKFSIASQKRSVFMLGLATKNMEPKLCGTSSVFRIASAWNMNILKYTDLLSCMKENIHEPTRMHTQVTKHKKDHVYSLRSAFIKVEDHSRKYKPEFVEMKSFPYLDLDSEGTTSPFDTWFRENYCTPPTNQ